MFIEKFKNTDSNGKIKVYNKIQCDQCSLIWVETRAASLDKLRKRPEQLCPKCLPILINKISSERMKITQSKIGKEQRKINASNGGKLAQLTGKCNKTWFTKDRWDSMTQEEQQLQVHRANKAFIEKLKTMTTDELADHYKKVMKGKMGFISKGQQELIDSLNDLNFIGNHPISSLTVDCCNIEYKIIIEYNGDVYHCNPKYWKHEQYNTLIKMTAGEKWEKDRKRLSFLRRLGYYIIVVWESDWKLDKDSIIKNIREKYEIIKNRENSKTKML